MAGVYSGVGVIVVLLLVGPLLDRTPIAALAGLLLVVAYDLVEPARIRQTLRASPADALAFVVTVLGTWLLSLDVAIYLGVGLSLVLHLRKARLLVVRDLGVNEEGRLVERSFGTGVGACPHIRILHIEGRLFFAASGELSSVLDDALRADSLRVLIVRLKRAPGLDASTAAVFAAAAQAAKLNGRHLLLVGLGPEAMGVLERSEAALAIGAENLFPTQTRWFAALDAARARALQLVGPGCAPCPLSAAHFDAHAGDVSKTFQRVPTVLKHGDEDRDVNGSV
jgi:SulP family sulfate permease